MVLETSKKILVVREKIRVAQSRYKNYVDKHCKDLEFEVGDHVLLKASLVQGIVGFGQKRWGLSPHYFVPFENLEHLGKIAYRLALPPKMSGVHNVFQVSMLRK